MIRRDLRVAVLGAAGYIGGELLRLLAVHPDIAEIEALSRTQGGKAWGEVHPAFAHDCKRLFSSRKPEEAAAKSDVVFLALGHGESAHIMPKLLESGAALVIDLAADFRLSDEDSYRKHYGEHPCFDLCSTFIYGLPEANRDAIRTARRIANPGCMATATELLLLPLAEADVLPDDAAVFAVTGSSGSGQSLKATAHHPFRASNFFIYKPLAHQHEAEIARLLTERARRSVSPRMIAHSAPLVRGIHASAYLASPRFAAADIADLYMRRYADEPFVHVRKEPPNLAMAAGTNHVHIGIMQHEGEILLSCVIDNLVKGGAGQAIQNMNLAIGLAESAGLDGPGFFPY